MVAAECRSVQADTSKRSRHELQTDGKTDWFGGFQRFAQFFQVDVDDMILKASGNISILYTGWERYQTLVYLFQIRRLTREAPLYLSIVCCILYRMPHSTRVG